MEFGPENNRRIYRPHHHLIYELTPGYVSADGLTHHNERGFRGPPFDVPKPPGVFRIACMGESTTYCTGIAADRDTYPARLEHHLREARPDLKLEVINAGVGGYTSAENLLHFIFKVHPIEPDLVVFYFTHNDVHPRRFPTLSRDYREFSKSWFELPKHPSLFARLRFHYWKRFQPERFSISDAARRFAEHPRRPPENILKNPPTAFQQNMEFLVTLVRSSNIRLLLMLPPYAELELATGGEDKVHPGVWAIHQHREIVAEIGSRQGVPVYDLAKEMPYEGSGSPWQGPLHRDKVHVNEAGADVQGRLVAHQILEGGLLPASRATMSA